MATFVLIHGAFRGGWSFARLRPRLEARGHRTHAPSLPGAGEHFDDAPRDIPLRSYARTLARFLELEDVRDVILVGHSQGGLAISAASQLAHERIACLVFVDAPVPRHGERVADLVPPGLAHLPKPSFPRDLVIPPRPVTASAELSEADAAWINARTTPAHVSLSLDPLELDDPRALALPRHYLFCRHTPNTYPCAHGRARLEAEGTPYRWLESGHDVPITQPALLADALLEIASAPGTNVG